MPVPSSINSLSTTASSNSPAGSETPADGDNYIRTLSAFIATLRDQLNGTAATGTVKTAIFSGAQAGAASWSALQTFAVGANLGNAAQAAATTLDWYEEGTFEPTVIGGTTAGTGTYTAQVGRFTRIGNRVFVSIYVAWSAHTGTGTPKIGALPYTAAAATAMLVGTHYYGSVSIHPAVAYLSAAAATTGLVQTFLAASDAYANVALQSGDAAITLTGHYDV